MKTILVTGGAGFIGSHMVLCLLEHGYQVVTLDNLSNGHRDAVPGGTFILADVNDADALDLVFSGHRIDAVMHFAAFIEAGVSMREPLRFYRNNVAGTLTLLEAMWRHDVGALVFSSTAAIFGEPERLPLDEDHPTAPINPYGQGKLQVEKILADAVRCHGMSAVCLRYFNAAGADPAGRLGERHRPETHLIPLVLEVAAGKRPAISVFGDDYPTHDGTCVRDYIHVADLVRAHLAALRHLETACGFSAFNLGNGRGYSVREVIDAAARVTGRRIPVRIEARRPGDPASLIASSACAAAVLNWRPAFPELDIMVEHAWAFQQRRARVDQAAVLHDHVMKVPV